MTPAPLVSVVMPVFNGRAFLDDTIRSVLGQTYVNHELIVIDDGSTDGSAELLRGYPEIKVIQQENKGVPVARNRGVSESSGEMICFIDQDDTWAHDKLERQIEAFLTNPELKYCTTRQIFYLAEGAERPNWCQPEWLDKPLAGYAPSTLMIRRSTFLDFGQFDESLLTGSDTELFFKLKDANVPFRQLDEILVRKRVHGSNHSNMTEALRRDILMTVRRSIQRQRSNS